MLFEELNVNNCLQIKLLVDNKSMFHLENHHMRHGMSKHIEMSYYFVRDQVGKKRLNIEHCKTELQLAYILTKPCSIQSLKILKGHWEKGS